MYCFMTEWSFKFDLFKRLYPDFWKSGMRRALTVDETELSPIPEFEDLEDDELYFVLMEFFNRKVPLCYSLYRLSANGLLEDLLTPGDRLLIAQRCINSGRARERVDRFKLALGRRSKRLVDHDLLFEERMETVFDFLTYWAFPVEDFWKAEVQRFLDESFQDEGLSREQQAFRYRILERRYLRHFYSPSGYRSLDPFSVHRQFLARFELSHAEFVDCMRFLAVSRFSLDVDISSKDELLRLCRVHVPSERSLKF